MKFEALLIYIFHSLLKVKCNDPHDPHREEEEYKGVFGEYSLLSGRYELRLTIGNERPTQKMIIQDSPYSFFFPETIETNTSEVNTYIDSKLLDIRGDVYKGDEFSEQLDIFKVPFVMKDFHYYLLSKENKRMPKREGISFAYKMKDERFSVVHILKKSNQIDSLKYTLKPTSMFEGRIYFGTLPVNKRIKEGKKGYCNVDDRFDTWGCHMNKIYLENHTDIVYSYNDYFTFQINKRKAIVPCSFLNWVKDKILKEYFDNGDCYVVNGNNSKITLECKEFSTVIKFPKIYFVFDEFKIYKWVRDLFICYKDRQCFSQFKCIDGKEDQWIFGSSFLTDYELTFDYDNKKVTVGSKILHKDVINELTEFEKSIEKDIPKEQNSNGSIKSILNFIIAIIGIAIVSQIVTVLKSKGIDINI